MPKFIRVVFSHFLITLWLMIDISIFYFTFTKKNINYLFIQKNVSLYFFPGMDISPEVDAVHFVYQFVPGYYVF